MGCGTRSRSAPESVAKEGAGKRPRTEDAQGKPGGIFTQRKATELTAHAGQEGRQQEGTASRGTITGITAGAASGDGGHRCGRRGAPEGLRLRGPHCGAGGGVLPANFCAASFSSCSEASPGGFPEGFPVGFLEGSVTAAAAAARACALDAFLGPSLKAW